MNQNKNYTEEVQKNEQYNVKAIMFVLLLGSFLSIFNETILNVAFPTLMKEMHVAATTVQWLTTGYVLVVGILVPVTAFLMHTFTTKQLYVGAMTLVLIGTVCAVFSISFATLLISRIIQALGTGMLIPIMMNSALAVTPPEKHGSVLGICVSVIVLGPALGPTVSGLLLQFFSWHALFIILIPFLLICIICGCIFLKDTSVITKPKIDYLSIVLSSIGFAGIIYAVSAASTSNVLTTVSILAIGLIAIFLYGKRQLSLKQPILEIRTFKNSIFTIGTLLIIITQMLQFSINIILPLLLQDGLKTTSFVSALVLLPPILIRAVLSPVFGKIYDKIGGEILIPAGLAVMCIFTFVLSRVTPSTSVIGISLIYCFIMVGLSMCMSNSETTALNQLSSENQADGVAIINTVMQIAGALGSSLFLGIMTVFQNSYLMNVVNPNDSQNQLKSIYSGFGHAMAVAAILVAIGFILSLILNAKNKSEIQPKN